MRWIIGWRHRRHRPAVWFTTRVERHLAVVNRNASEAAAAAGRCSASPATRSTTTRTTTGTEPHQNRTGRPGACQRWRHHRFAWRHHHQPSSVRLIIRSIMVSSWLSILLVTRQFLHSSTSITVNNNQILSVWIFKVPKMLWKCIESIYVGHKM